MYKDISKGIEVRLNTSSYGLDRPSPKGKNKKGSVKWKKN